MSYFVTGATGFIGRRLVERLLARKGIVYFLILERELPLIEPLYKRWGVDGSRAVPIIGDLTQPKLGVSENDFARMRGNIKHMFHLAAIYDLKASEEIQQKVNIEGTRHALQFAEEVQVGCFNLTSSIAAAGLYDGVFREDMFEEADEGLEHPYYRTKHESEGIVRAECKRPWRIYRPGIVVGNSKTGEMDKIDGPYYFFKLIQRLRKIFPSWVPLPGLEGGRLNLVPVDFVVGAMDHIAHQEGHDNKCFHLTDPNPKRVGEILNLFARAAHGPQVSMFINAGMFSFIPSFIKQSLYSLPPVRRIVDVVMDDLGMPPDIVRFINYPTRFDCRETLKLLKDTDIKVPDLETYAHRLWDYWERNLDPELYLSRTLSDIVKGKTIVITGGSDGIGKAVALKLAEVSAKIVIVARDPQKLQAAKEEIEARGGKVFTYSYDLSDLNACDDFVKRVETDHGGADILINNAARSIRRSIAMSFDRFHDYERTMQLNYFSPLRLTMGFLPVMMRKKQGHVINISSIAVLNHTPRFSAYTASKAALEAFSRCAGSEFSDVHFTIVNMPLVRTPMIAPTKFYQNVPTMGPEEAAELVMRAIIYKPERLATRLGVFAQVIHALVPKVSHIIMNTAYHAFPETAGDKEGEKGQVKELTPAQAFFAQIMRGIHW